MSLGPRFPAGLASVGESAVDTTGAAERVLIRAKGGYVNRSSCGLTVMLIGILLLSGCGSVYKVVRPNEATGLLPTSVEVKPEEILVFQPSAVIHDARFVLLRTGTGGMHTRDFGTFMRSSLQMLGLENILDTTEFAKLVLASPLRATVGACQSFRSDRPVSSHRRRSDLPRRFLV
jgi:hypothetical protein